MTNTIYRAEFKNQSGDSYWRYFQKFNDHAGGTEWCTSRFHDRGFYAVASNQSIHESDDTLLISDHGQKGVITAYPYDHAETERLVDKLVNQAYDKIDKATEALEDAAIAEANEAEDTTPFGVGPQADESAMAMVVEISANHVWLSGPGALVRIAEISFCVAIDDGTFPKREKSMVVMKNGGQVTLDLPLEILYDILGSLAPKK